MTLTPALCAALLATNCGMIVHGADIWLDSHAKSGRAVNVIVTNSRTLVVVCHHEDCPYGYESARFYGDPADTLPRAMAALATHAGIRE